MTVTTPSTRTIGHAEEVMGTVVSFTVAVGPDASGTAQATADRAIRDACRALHEADEIFSTWVDSSPMSRLRRGELALEQCPIEVEEVLALSAVARDGSAGWFDPWAMPGGVDPTGLVKGWAVERAAKLLADAGVGVAMVNGGGDIATVGRPGPAEPWRVGIQHPWRPDALACILGVERSVATSATYERGPHLFDPRSGVPGVRAASATVIGPSLAMADAYATALAVGGDDAFDAVVGGGDYDAYLIRPDGSERMSAGVVVLS